MDIVDRAYAAAEAEGRDKCVMILFPCYADWSKHNRVILNNIHVRYSDQHSGLKMLPVDTLIVVDPDSDEWDSKGCDYAKERLRASRDGKITLIERSVACG
jgi:hypothetical protein